MAEATNKESYKDKIYGTIMVKFNDFSSSYSLLFDLKVKACLLALSLPYIYI